MKYCISYYSDFRYFNEVDEVILRYSNHNENIIEFVKSEFKNQRIIIDITNKLKEIDSIIPILRKLYQEYPNMVVKTSFSDYKKLAALKIPYFFAEFCRTQDEVYAFIHQGVTDVYVVEDLAFNLKDIGKYCYSLDVNVRVFPNMAQYCLNQKDYIPDPFKFFIRPEDIRSYEDIVDVCELLGPSDRLSVLFSIYKNEKWKGNIKDIILGFEDDSFNGAVHPDFGKARTGCKHSCMQEKCELCKEFLTISNTMRDLNLEIDRPNKSWRITNESKIDEETMRNDETTDTNNDVKVSQE